MKKFGFPIFRVIQIHENDIIATSVTNVNSNTGINLGGAGHGIVTKAEAENAKILVLDRGGRLNIIEDYTFLRAFPNLEALSVGNTTLETIDLSANTHLQRLNLQNALWINTLILAPDCNPEILYPQGIDSVTIERK